MQRQRQKNKRPVVLIIRDGWGINPDGYFSMKADGNASLLANTPFHNAMYATYPMSHIKTSGEDVGLPKGQMGNSEVGHMNLGAGRIVYQDLSRINATIANNALGENEVLQEVFSKLNQSQEKLHLIGLVSDGGVHSHQNHLIALSEAARNAGVKNILVHAITDGRDTSPTGAGGEKGFLSKVEDALGNLQIKIATVVGRYYAMDRDHRWDRTKLAWDAIVHGVGEELELLASQAVADKYLQDRTDEFMPALILSHANQQRVNDGDTVIFFNFRADRARQLSEAFLMEGFKGFKRGDCPKVDYVTMTEYDKRYDCKVIFGAEVYQNSLGEVVSKANLSQLRIAETEKYPHVTYFFNVGQEKSFPNEVREIIPSPQVATYDLQPEMSADKVTKKVLDLLPKFDLVILNFANTDMVGHTGIVEAGIKAVEKVDACLEKVVSKTLSLGGQLLITADHGNCEFMRNANGSPNTAHTTFLVHLIYVSAEHENISLKNGILADIAPTLLDMLGLEKPSEMTGSSLIIRN